MRFWGPIQKNTVLLVDMFRFTAIYHQVTDQTAIDNFMLQLDGTENKSKFGANAILAVSLAVCKAGAAHKAMPLYQHIAGLFIKCNGRFPAIPLLF